MSLHNISIILEKLKKNYFEFIAIINITIGS